MGAGKEAYMEFQGRRIKLHEVRDMKERIRITIEVNREVLHDRQFNGYAVPFSKEELEYAEKHTINPRNQNRRKVQHE